MKFWPIWKILQSTRLTSWKTAGRVTEECRNGQGYLYSKQICSARLGFRQSTRVRVGKWRLERHSLYRACMQCVCVLCKAAPVWYVNNNNSYFVHCFPRNRTTKKFRATPICRPIQCTVCFLIPGKRLFFDFVNCQTICIMHTLQTAWFHVILTRLLWQRRLITHLLIVTD